MARSDRRKSQRQNESFSLTQDEQAVLDSLIGETSSLAAALREASGNRDEIARRLASVTSAPEPAAQSYAVRLARMRGESGSDAIDIAHALGELDPRRKVARDARRSRITLRSLGFVPTLDVPMHTQAAVPVPTMMPVSSDSADMVPSRPRFAGAYASVTRDQGEMRLVVAWHESADDRWVRGYAFGLQFWDKGVAQVAHIDLMTLARFNSNTRELLGLEESETFVAVTWAEARRLLTEALEVGAWRNVALPPEYTRHEAQIRERLLDLPEDEDLRAAVTEEERKAAREGDRRFISANMIPDEVVANWIGAWTFGDYGLAYDLLADSNPIRQRTSRDEYISTRRAWMENASPSALRLTVVREQPQRASALWVPGGGKTLGESKDLEAFWSVVMTDTELTGQIDEAAMGTLISKVTGRHWFWTGFTMTHDRSAGLWLISKIRDEGASSQSLTVEELQSRLKAARDKTEELTHQPPPQPGTDAAFEVIQTITAELSSALHYTDALIVRVPLDEKLYWDGITDARTLGNHERAAALMERMRGRFNDDVRIQFEQALEYFLVSDQLVQAGRPEPAHEWLERAVSLMREVVAADRTAEHLQGLGELLARQGHLSEAEEQLRAAIALDKDRATAYTDLADVLMSRAAGEDVERPGMLSTDEQRAHAQEALAILREAAKLASPPPGMYTRMGAIYEMLKQPEDALIAFEEAVRKDPGDADAQYTLGAVLVDRKQPERAREHLENAVQLQPVNLMYRVALARAYVMLGRTAEATRELNFVDQMQPGLPAVAEVRTLIARERAAR